MVFVFNNNEHETKGKEKNEGNKRMMEERKERKGEEREG
jgi:hypothetical protein